MRITSQTVSSGPFDDSPEMQALTKLGQGVNSDLIKTTYGHFASQLAELIDREIGYTDATWKLFSSNPAIFQDPKLNTEIPSYAVQEISCASLKVLMGVINQISASRIQQISEMTDRFFGSLVRLGSTSELTGLSFKSVLQALNSNSELELIRCNSTRSLLICLAPEMTFSDCKEEIEQHLMEDPDNYDCPLNNPQLETLRDVVKEVLASEVRIKSAGNEYRLQKEIQGFLWVTTERANEIHDMFKDLRNPNKPT